MVVLPSLLGALVLSVAAAFFTLSPAGSVAVVMLGVPGCWLGSRRLLAWLTRDLRAPLKQIVESTRSALDQSDFSRPMPEGLLQEWAELATVINELQTVIQLKEVELERAQDRLEAIVSERTSELTALNEELRAARDRAEAGAMSKSQFLANMSHEIRTPMNGILGMTELLLQSNLEGEHQELLQTIRSSAENLLVVINDVLDFSKIDAGKLELNPKPFSLREAIAAAVGPLALQAEKRGLELVLSFRPGTPDRLAGDAIRLRQIVTNLVGNAVKFTETGEIEITCDRESRKLGESTLLISVRDTGIGVAEEDWPSIFRAFEQADGSSVRQHGGTGLGLAIACQLAELMGGRLWIESEPGKGSTFHFTVRMSSLSEEGQEEGYLSGDDVAAPGVLVVEDSLTARASLTSMLQSLGLPFAEAGDGGSAMATLDEARGGGNPFPVVLVDSSLPGMDGVELAARIGRSKGLAGSVILMLPQSERLSSEARGRTSGVQSFVSKPVVPGELIQALRVALGKEAPQELKEVTGLDEKVDAPGLRILLVEDNPVNRKLAVRMLVPRGHRVTLAEDGVQAVQAVENGEFDLILMDLSMPQMDGLQATAVIRGMEKGSGRHIRIVAITAHALVGDRERCLEAGMDGYLTKPLRLAELFSMVEGSTATSLPNPEDVRSGPDRSLHGISRSDLLTRFEGSSEALKDIAEVFLENSGDFVDKIRAALSQSDAEELRHCAHSLKGAITIFAVPSAYEAAFELEKLAGAGDLEAAGGQVESVVSEVERLEQALRELAI